MQFYFCFTFICLNVYMQVCIHLNKCVYTYLLMYVCVCVYVWVGVGVGVTERLHVYIYLLTFFS
jgi:hypothetical protein